MKRKPKPLHQLARDKNLTPHDAHELQLFREFMRLPESNPQKNYESVYGDQNVKEQKP